VNLLWQPAQAPGRDYTVSTFLLDAGGVLVSQQDGYPFENRSPTHDWEAGGLYFDGHTLPTGALLPGDYRVGVKVYFFTDDFQTLTIALASDCSANPACEFIIIDSVHVD
jgi:hypothetical protein